MASLVKTCAHRRPKWSECPHPWYLRERVAGKDRYTNLGPDQAAAARALRQRQAVQGETVRESVEAWIAMRERQPGARPNSIGSYKSRAEHIYRALGTIPVAALREHHVVEFVDKLLAALAPSTAQGVYSLLSASLKHARRRKALTVLPLPPDGPGIPGAQAREHDLTLAQVDLIISRVEDPTWRALAEVVYLTGLRWGEAVAIRPEDVEGGLLRVRETANRYAGTNPAKTRHGVRILPLSPRAQELLARLDLPVGGRYSAARDALVKAMGPLHREGMGWHSLRAAHATLLDSAGVSLREAAARMGHGPRFAQTLSYRVRSEAGDAQVVDLARERARRGAA